MRFILFLMLLCSCTPQDMEVPLPSPPVEQPDTPQTSHRMKITIANATFTATLAAGATVTALKAMLPLTLNMSDFKDNEKVCSLPRGLTTSASNPGTIHTGDIMLYGSNSLVVFYETFSTSYHYTPIGRIDNVTGLKAALGSGSVTLKLELE